MVCLLGNCFICIRRVVTEREEIIPATVVVSRYDAVAWACPKGSEAPKQLFPPSSVVLRAKWELLAFARVAVSKYADHCPIHRRAGILRRAEVDSLRHDHGGRAATQAIVARST